MITTNVIIPAGLANYPTIQNNPAYCFDIFFQSDSNGTATILDNGNLTINGIATVQLYFSGNAADWHLVSPPVSAATANVFLNMYMMSFSEATDDWNFITDPSTPMNVMEGYAIYSTLSSFNTVTFIGNPNLGEQSAGFTALSQGWNLLGNPYISSIDWEMVSIPPGLSNEVQYLEAATGNFLAYVKGTGGPGSQYIPPMQGFFVKASGSGTFSLGNLQRTHNGANNFYKSKNTELLILEASGEIYSDQAWIHFNDSAGVEHDGIYDACKKISTSNPELPQLFSVTPSGTRLSVNGMPDTTKVSLGFTAVESGVFTISAPETGYFPFVYLEDLVTGTIADLLTDNYTFVFIAGTLENRFIVHFTEHDAVSENKPDLVNIYSYHNEVYIYLPENTQGVITITNLLGQEITKTRTTDNVIHKVFINYSGLYIVRVVSDGFTMTKKVIIG